MYDFYSKLAVHGRVADLRCLWVACTQGAEENETKPFVLSSRRSSNCLKSRTCEFFRGNETGFLTSIYFIYDGVRRCIWGFPYLQAKMEAHDQRKHSKRMEEGDSRQVNSGMRYFAQSLEQHLEEVLEYVVKDVDPCCGPATPSTPSLTTTTTSLGVHKANCEDGNILLTSESSKVVIAKSLPSSVKPEEEGESVTDRRAALEWLASVRQGRHKRSERQKRQKLGPEKEEEGSRTSYCTEEGGNSSQEGRIVSQKGVVPEEGSCKDAELSTSSCDSDDSGEDRSKLEAVAVTFVGGVMQASHKS